MTHPTLEDLQNEATWLERRALIPGTAQANTLETIENETRDFIGRVILDHPRKETASPTAPTSPQEGDIWFKG